MTDPQGPAPPSSRSSATTAAEMLEEMMRTPFFMNPNAQDTAMENNDLIEAFRAMQYEGTPEENALSFKETGNELYKERKFKDAREFYDKALAVLEQEMLDSSLADERSGLREKLLVNRAASNLPLRNYRMVIRDCIEVLRSNPSHQKAMYRSAQALQFLDRPQEALAIVDNALSVSPEDLSFRALQTTLKKILFRKKAAEQKKGEEAELKLAHREALLQAFRMREWRVILPKSEDQEAGIPPFELSNPSDPTSTISFPVQFAYPLSGPPPITELVRSVSELDKLGSHLEDMLDDPGQQPSWDTKGEYKAGVVDCYMETISKDGSAGLLKAGKKVKLANILSRGSSIEDQEAGKGRVEVRNGIVKVLVVPRAKAEAWIREFKERVKAL